MSPGFEQMLEKNISFDTLKNSKVDWKRDVLNWQEDMHDGAALIDFTPSLHT